MLGPAPAHGPDPSHPTPVGRGRATPAGRGARGPGWVGRDRLACLLGASWSFGLPVLVFWLGLPSSSVGDRLGRGV